MQKILVDLKHVGKMLLFWTIMYTYNYVFHLERLASWSLPSVFAISSSSNITYHVLP